MIASRYSYGCMLEIHNPYTFLGVRFSLVKFCFDDETLLESVDLLASVNAYGAIERESVKMCGVLMPRRLASVRHLRPWPGTIF
jgi:hypothetical protein